MATHKCLFSCGAVDKTVSCWTPLSSSRYRTSKSSRVTYCGFHLVPFLPPCLLSCLIFCVLQFCILMLFRGLSVVASRAQRHQYCCDKAQQIQPVCGHDCGYSEIPKNSVNLSPDIMKYKLYSAFAPLIYM